MTESLTGKLLSIVVFVAILLYFQYIYAERMLSTKESQWIEVNNYALDYFGGVPALVYVITANKQMNKELSSMSRDELEQNIIELTTQVEP